MLWVSLPVRFATLQCSDVYLSYVQWVLCFRRLPVSCTLGAGCRLSALPVCSRCPDSSSLRGLTGAQFCSAGWYAVACITTVVRAIPVETAGKNKTKLYTSCRIKTTESQNPQDSSQLIFIAHRKDVLYTVFSVQQSILDCCTLNISRKFSPN